MVYFFTDCEVSLKQLRGDGGGGGSAARLAAMLALAVRRAS
jgi:hypothetical protein